MPPKKPPKNRNPIARDVRLEEIPATTADFDANDFPALHPTTSEATSSSTVTQPPVWNRTAGTSHGEAVKEKEETPRQMKMLTRNGLIPISMERHDVSPTDRSKGVSWAAMASRPATTVEPTNKPKSEGETENATAERRMAAKKKRQTIMAAKREPSKQTSAFGDFLVGLDPPSRRPTGDALRSSIPRPSLKTQTPAVQMDASAPLVHSKGKEKKKKPTLLKKKINMDKERLQQAKEVVAGNGCEASNDKDAASEEEDHKPQMTLEESTALLSQFKENMPKHSMKFRGYCTNSQSVELSAASRAFLERLKFLHDRAYRATRHNPVKFVNKRRVIVGLREVRRVVQSSTARIVFVATDIKPSPKEGSLDTQIALIIDGCATHDIPVIFTMRQRQLGKVLLKGTAACCAVINYQSAEELLAAVQTQFAIACEEYRRKGDEDDPPIISVEVKSSQVGGDTEKL